MAVSDAGTRQVLSIDAGEAFPDEFSLAQDLDLQRDTRGVLIEAPSDDFHSFDGVKEPGNPGK